MPSFGGQPTSVTAEPAETANSTKKKRSPWSGKRSDLLR